jgi:hypothetical protein
MSNLFENYVQSISSKFSHKETSEMGYRADFENLLKGIFESINVRRVDHDARAKLGNKPDFIVLSHDVPILYIETKDIGVSLDKTEKSEQMVRYYGYANLVLTDYVEFRFYRNGLGYVTPITIAICDVKHRTIVPIPENYEHLAKTLVDFAQSHKEPIRSGEHLARIMGGKARRIRDNVKQFLSNESEKNAEIARIYGTIKKLLVHDISKESFADMYAQTLVYGLFVARYHDATPEHFSRQKARDLVPASNPFLRHFFDHIVGPDFDRRLEYIVNELCMVFSHANVRELMKQYFGDDLWGKTHEGPDPVVHFYEDFLKEYDPDLRKKLGAFYTPLPVVRFIVRSVDFLLERDFDLPSGLADTSKASTGIHRVQILDPAVGTGTFISAVIRIIYSRLLKAGQKGRWTTYVHNDLLPRVHGFELMMAPYTIAHLKLSMAFKETGFWNFHRRLGIYLTNSLEESETREDLFTGFGLAESIAEESKEASVIKSRTPIMVVIGNPPYSVSSSNEGEWILNLIKDYKKGLNEKKINLDDDYIKFLRFSEHFIEKNKSGIVAMITNNSFIDGITHRQMRKHLLDTFDDIYVLDLHGNSKKSEKAPDGSKDVNVFDIQQGVAISIFVRKASEKKSLATVHHAELYGKREDKFKSLDENDITDIKWKRLDYTAPYYFFVPKDFGLKESYDKGFYLKDLFSEWSTGVETQNDGYLLGYSKQNLLSTLREAVEHPIKEERFVDYLSKNEIEEDKAVQLMHKPFDYRWTYLDSKVLGRARLPFMYHLTKPNVALICARQYTSQETPGVFVSAIPAAHKSFSANDKTVLFPLYLYAGDGTRATNLRREIVGEIEKIVGKTKPTDIFDFIYAVLHSQRYRDKYKEFLKIDFPRVPYPKDQKRFKKLTELGAELRSFHLLESPKVNQFITTYPISGSDIIEKLAYKQGNVYINKDQCFGNVPESAWNLCIGGYQPAQKWLKDRKGRTLSNADIEHYQKMIVALAETERVIKEIDAIR